MSTLARKICRSCLQKRERDGGKESTVQVHIKWPCFRIYSREEMSSVDAEQKLLIRVDVCTLTPPPHTHLMCCTYFYTLISVIAVTIHRYTPSPLLSSLLFPQSSSPPLAPLFIQYIRVLQRYLR